MARNASINYTVGLENYTSADAAFDHWAKDLRRLKRKLGDLTKPFDEISPVIIHNIKWRMEDNTFGKAPFNTETSKFTRAVRRAKGYPPSRPKLVQSGYLEHSIQRLPSPTKSKTGERREVLVLRIGTIGVSYAKDVIDGGTWEVPILKGPRGGTYLDLNRIRGGSMSNAEYYGEKWGRMSSYKRATKTIEIPGRNIFTIFPEDSKFINKVFEKWITENLGENK